VSLGEWCQIFQRMVYLHLQGPNNPPLMMKILRVFEMSGTAHPTVYRHIPQDLSPQQDRCENLKYRMELFAL
jgi:hypothetical protein